MTTHNFAYWHCPVVDESQLDATILSVTSYPVPDVEYEITQILSIVGPKVGGEFRVSAKIVPVKK